MFGRNRKIILQILLLTTLTVIFGIKSLAAQSEDRLVYVTSAEVNTYDPKDNSDWHSGVFDVYETLTRLNAETGEIEPRLALSWERLEPTVWRFVLREDVTFHNGEPFTAEAVEVSFTRLAQPDALNQFYAGPLAEAHAVDDYTVDVVTSEPDPTFPHRAIFLFVGAPQWLQTASADEIATTAVGTGPYKLAEWIKGQHTLLQRNDDYWGTPASIPEIEIVVRPEAVVRANMVAVGEADIAYSINFEDADQVPVAVPVSNVRVQGLRLNAQHPVLQDVRVRKAFALAIDTTAIAETIYSGFVQPANGQLVNSSTVGWNPNLAQYAYDPAEATRLLEEADAVGTPITVIGRVGGYFQKDTEQLEAIINMLNAVGFSAQLQIVDNSVRGEYFRSGAPDAPQSDVLHIQHGNDLMDSELTFGAYYQCGAITSQFCDPQLDELIEVAAPLTGEERDMALQEAWAYVYDQYPIIPTINVEFLFALAENVDWTPRVDGILYFSEVSWK